MRVAGVKMKKARPILRRETTVSVMSSSATHPALGKKSTMMSEVMTMKLAILNI